MSSMKNSKSFKRNLGLIAFMNSGGLGIQTKRLAHMLKPERIMVINSSGFSPNKDQHPEWYQNYNFFTCNGFPNDEQVKKFLQNLTHVFTVENPYNFNLVWYGQQQGTKIYCQSNYEFCDNLNKPYLPVPDLFLMPSYWKLDEMRAQFGESVVKYLPPPIDPDEFAVARKINLKRTGKPRFLHIIGTLASYDRNGTLDLLSSLKCTYADFELVIHTQHPIPMEYFLDDKRVTYRIENKLLNADLYKDFDALLLPRRYGGLSLTTNEALMAGLPVFMTDISPNNRLLPKEWLFDSIYKSSFIGRSKIETYSARKIQMATKIDWLVKQDFSKLKEQAFELGMKNFSEDVLKPQYAPLFKGV